MTYFYTIYHRGFILLHRHPPWDHRDPARKSKQTTKPTLWPGSGGQKFHPRAVQISKAALPFGWLVGWSLGWLIFCPPDLSALSVDSAKRLCAGGTRETIRETIRGIFCGAEWQDAVC